MGNRPYPVVGGKWKSTQRVKYNFQMVLQKLLQRWIKMRMSVNENSLNSLEMGLLLVVKRDEWKIKYEWQLQRFCTRWSKNVKVLPGSRRTRGSTRWGAGRLAAPWVERSHSCSAAPPRAPPPATACECTTLWGYI